MLLLHLKKLMLTEDQTNEITYAQHRGDKNHEGKQAQQKTFEFGEFVEKLKVGPEEQSEIN